MYKFAKRKPDRLKKYDYSEPGFYYGTICTHKRECIFGVIENAEVHGIINIGGNQNNPNNGRGNHATTLGQIIV